jgi:uncharacterized delta-60 repeat protein
LDSTFGSEGTVRAYINSGDNEDRGWSVAIQSDGKIVVGGSSVLNLTISSFGIARFNSNGTKDTTFGSNGAVTTTFGSDINIDDEARSIAIQTDGKILAGGWSQSDAGGPYFVLARYLKSNVTGILESKSLPKSFALEQNYPNPFNPTTTINFQLPAFNHVTIKVYNILGKEIATLVNGEKSAGNYSVQFNGSKLSSGVYLYRMQAGSFVQTKKILLLK